MLYGIYNFPTEEILVKLYNTAADAHNVCAHNSQCVILRASTDEDERYLGIDWLCTHCIPAETCIYCNPAYKDAVIASCPACSEIALTMGFGQPLTWHVGGECLKCKE